MSRPIKFRAWFKYAKRMQDVLAVDFSNKKVYIEADNKGVPRSYLYFDDCELMQSTGLQDKNGKEIYEGDIVRRTCGTIGAEHEDFTGIVKYGCAAFMLESFDGNDGRYLWDDVQELEILGNIYQTCIF